VVHPNFVGAPTIHVFDVGYRPCRFCTSKCHCGRFEAPIQSTIVLESNQWSQEEIVNRHGIAVVTLKCNKELVHPVLNLWNEKKKKCETTNLDEHHMEITVDSYSLRTCLVEAGYELVKVFAFYEFVLTESLWKEITMKLYVQKTIHSGNEPEDKRGFLDRWEQFPGMEEFFEESWHQWGNHPAQKKVAKIAVNCVWGKHAERVNMPQVEIFDYEKDRSKVERLYANFGTKAYSMQGASVIHPDRKLVQYRYIYENAKKNLHKGYLPAALMIPAYGRIQLWREMNKLGTRVLMCDTDSIVYVDDPDLYSVPTGTLMGEWEEEDCSVTGIEEFVAWGPKTYGLRMSDGSTIVKAKGLSLNYATENLFNFNVMREKALAFLRGDPVVPVGIPQFNFDWSMQKDMQTVYSLKNAQINRGDLKGVLRDGYLYPHGYVNNNE
jgi:hypothetical protein